MSTRSIARTGAAALLVAAGLASTGCIIVADGKTELVRIEKRKAEAQYLAARAEIEKINLEREKAGLPRINLDDKDALVKEPPCDPELSD